MSGVWFTSGTHIRASNIGFSIDRTTGEVIAKPIALSLALDTWQHWLDMAIDNVLVAVAAADEADACFEQGSDGDEAGNAVLREMRASMAAVSFAAFALEAFYAAVVERSPLPEEISCRWRRGRTSRYGRLFESLRYNFKFSNDMAKEYSRVLRQVFNLRDQAVHPNAGFAPAALHPRFGRGADVRILRFRAYNAFAATIVVHSIIRRCLERPRPKAPTTLTDWVVQASASSDALRDRWFAVGLPEQIDYFVERRVDPPAGAV